MTLDAISKKGIKDICDNVQWDVALDSYTTFKIGGNALALTSVGSEKQLVTLLQFCHDIDLPHRVIGRGSNLVVADEGFAGIIIILEGDFLSIEIVQELGFSRTMQVGAGVSLTRLCRFTQGGGYAGAEFLLGIPGTVGGAIRMNAGAWGDEICNIITAVTLVTKEGAQYLTRAQIPYSYRSWDNFEQEYSGAVITEMHIQLHQAHPEQVKEECRVFLEKRKNAQPIKEPNAGSFFKNPSSKSAGQLIEECGFKGKRVGDAMVSMQHANFFINCGDAKARDLYSLMSLVQKGVEEQTGISLEPEVHFI